MDEKGSSSSNKIKNSKRKQKLFYSGDSPSANRDETGASDSSLMASILRDKDLMRLKILPYLNVVSLVEKIIVCNELKDHCMYAIEARTTTPPKAFADRRELSNAVRKYIEGDRDDLEDVATTYGYPIDNWDVSQVKDFSLLFQFYKKFNENIGSWNTSNATNMYGMFWHAKAFNCDISRWNVSNVRDMRRMFMHAKAFNQDLATWDVSNVTDMECMFFKATAFNGDVSTWDTSNVISMSEMFDGATLFNQDGILNWTIADETNTEFMFGE